MKEELLHWFLVSYHWSANRQSGHGHKTLCGTAKNNRMKDINIALDSIKDTVQKELNHNKEAISVVILNIVYLDNCSREDFYKKD